MKNKLVSIVLPTYNGSKFIKDSLESILSQIYQNWELIIVNDCSTDNTLEICKEFALLLLKMFSINNVGTHIIISVLGVTIRLKK